MTLAHAVSPDLESVAGAQARLLDGVVVLAPERVNLEQALGRILAESVSTQSDLPGFDNSAMDGYAVRASEIRSATASIPVRLPVVGESRAGSMPSALATGTAMRIMTGAPMPAGADTVVRQEDTSRATAHQCGHRCRRGTRTRRTPGGSATPRGAVCDG
jgi:molybdopterin molybdotransferase